MKMNNQQCVWNLRVSGQVDMYVDGVCSIFITPKLVFGYRYVFKECYCSKYVKKFNLMDFSDREFRFDEQNEKYCFYSGAGHVWEVRSFKDTKYFMSIEESNLGVICESNGFSKAVIDEIDLK